MSVDGEAARFYVRAGLDPFYARPITLDAAIIVLMRGRMPGLDDLSVEDRAYVAVEAIRGWLTRPEATGPGDGESEPPAPVIWHRAFGDTRVLVGVAS